MGGDLITHILRDCFHSELKRLFLRFSFIIDYFEKVEYA